MNQVIKRFLPTAEAIQRLLHPYAEVVVHDIKRNQIAAIFHPFSKRRVGDPSLLTPEDMNVLEDCIGPYEKLNWNGNKLKSMSSVIRDETNQAVGLLCINLDISRLINLSQELITFIQGNQLIAQPQPLFKDDWQEKINQYVHTYLSERHLNLESLDRNEKKFLIEHLNKIGAFTGKNAAAYVAQILGISRATVYNYLRSS
ncbi:MAG: PAS domain-containing protein [Proteobacteria bacterium]|nr:PAS domain-containing protein [Pseudomonadota bacterium]